MDDPIDFIFTYIDFSDNNYRKLLIDYAKKVDEKILKSKNLFLNRYKDFDEIYFSIQSVKKYLRFIRKIYIVTPTPNRINDIFKNDEQIIIIKDDKLLDKNVITPCFKSTVIESYLYKIPNISNIFMYGCDDMFISKKINKSELFENNLPIIDLQKDNNLNRFKDREINISSQSAYFTDIINANRYFQEKYNKYYSFTHNHQITLMRKDICIETHNEFNDILIKNGKNHFRVPKKFNIHFILLHHLIGLKKNKFINKQYFKKSGFYEYVMKNASERLGYLKDKKVSLFCLNDMNVYFYKYFQYSILNNLKNRCNIKKILFIYDKNDFLYLIPSYDRYFRKFNCKLLNISDFDLYSSKNNLSSSLILYIDSNLSKNIEKKLTNFYYLFINSDYYKKFIEDIYFFLNEQYPFNKIDKDLKIYNENNFKINLSKEMKNSICKIRNNNL